MGGSMNKVVVTTVLTLAFLFASIVALAIGASAAAGWFGLFSFICMWETLSG